MIYLIGAALVLGFIVGKRYGALVQKSAVAVAVNAATTARTALADVIAKAQAEAKAEAERLETLAKRYL